MSDDRFAEVALWRGLRDAHLHFAEHGEALSGVDVSGCASVDECLALVVRAVESEEDAGSWLFARGARAEGGRERRLPTAGELDEASGGWRVVVQSFDHHAAACSTAALRDARVMDAAGAIAGDVEARFVAMDEAGRATGVVYETAFKRVIAAMPPADDARYEGFVRAAQKDLLRLGFVEAHEMFGTRRFAETMVRLEEAGELRMRVVVHATPEHFEGVRQVLAGRGSDARVVLGGLKLFTDGTLNSRTALMLQEYADPVETSPRGVELIDREALAEHMRWAADPEGGAGVDVATHAIGDGAVRNLLDAYDEVEAQSGGDPGFRLRIEHAQFIDEADVGRFVRRRDGSVRARPVVASLQPSHLLTDIEAIRRLLPHREERAFVLRELAESARSGGVEPREVVWLGSDAPVVLPTPRDNVVASVLRRRERMAEADAVGLGQALGVGEVGELYRAK